MRVRTRCGIFIRGQPQRVTEEGARFLRINEAFTQLIGVKYIGKKGSYSLRCDHGRIVAIPRNEVRLVPTSLIYKLSRLPDFEFVAEDKLIAHVAPVQSRGPLAAMPIRSFGVAPLIDIRSLGLRGDGSHGSLTSAPPSRYRLGVFTARPQGYISGGYFHVWMTANVLCKYFDVTVVAPAIPQEYVDVYKDPRLEVIADTDYLFDMGYSPFDMIMSLHGRCGEYATKYATKYNIPVYLHCFEPGNLVKAKLAWGHFDEKHWGFRREMFQRVDYTICSNKLTREWTRKWLDVDPRKVVDCVPPLNFQVADKVHAKEKHEVVFISRLLPYKRPMDVLEVVKRIDPTLTMNFIGAGESMAKRIHTKAQELNLKTNFYDGITEKEKFKIIKQSKFMILPTSFEGYGLPPAEALYCKKPCVSYDIPVLVENYKDMLEFAHERDIEDLAAKAKRLLDDPEYRKQRGIQGHAFIKERLSHEACELSYIPIMPPVRISFLIIVFEGADYLKQCLEQIYPHAWEILIAEGAVNLMSARKGYWRSADETVNIIKRFPDPDHKIKLTQINDRAWIDKAEMKSVLLKKSTGHILWQIDADEFYRHEDIEKIIQEFIDDAGLDLIEVYYYSFWKDFKHYRVDGKWGQGKFTRIWRKRGQLSWTYHDCPHREGKPYRGGHFKGKQMGRILYHYGYVRSKALVLDKIEFMAARDGDRAKIYIEEFNQWLSDDGGDIRTFDKKHPEAIERLINGKSARINNRRKVALPA